MLSTSRQSIVAACLVLGVAGIGIGIAGSRAESERVSSGTSAPFYEQSRLTNVPAGEDLLDVGPPAGAALASTPPDDLDRLLMSVDPSERTVPPEAVPEEPVALSSALITRDDTTASFADAGERNDATIVPVNTRADEAAPGPDVAMLDRAIAQQATALQTIGYQFLGAERYDVQALLLAAYASTANDLANTRALRASLVDASATPY